MDKGKELGYCLTMSGELNRSVKGIWTECPYLSSAEVERFWQQARGLAKQRGVYGPKYWPVVRQIAKRMATKLDEQRRQADEKDWDASTRSTKLDGD